MDEALEASFYSCRLFGAMIVPHNSVGVTVVWCLLFFCLLEGCILWRKLTALEIHDVSHDTQVDLHLFVLATDPGTLDKQLRGRVIIYM